MDSVGSMVIMVVTGIPSFFRTNPNTGIDISTIHMTFLHHHRDVDHYS